MDDRRDDGGVVTGTGITSVPEVEAVNEVTDGETPVGATVAEMAVPLLVTVLSTDGTVLSADGTVLSVAEDTMAVLSTAVAEDAVAVLSIAVAEDAAVVLPIAVAEVRLLSVATEATVLFAGTEIRVPGVEVVKASLVMVPETSLVASDTVAEVVAEMSPERSVAVVLLTIDCGGIVALSVVFAPSVTEAVICDVAKVLVPDTELSVAVAAGRELESVMEPETEPETELSVAVEAGRELESVMEPGLSDGTRQSLGGVLGRGS